MKQKDVFAKLRALGLTATRCRGNYRVAYPGPRSEDTAYYTADLADLLSRGRAMAKRTPDERLLKMHCPSTSLH